MLAGMPEVEEAMEITPANKIRSAPAEILVTLSAKQKPAPVPEPAAGSYTEVPSLSRQMTGASLSY